LSRRRDNWESIMTWTYDDTLSTDKDIVRFYTGDVLTADQQVSNEGIAALLAIHSTPLTTAAQICRSLAARYSRQADQEIDDLRKSLSQRAKAYADRAKELEALDDKTLALSVPVLYAGGISVADKASVESDTDRVQPFFTRDLMEYAAPVDDDV